MRELTEYGFIWDQIEVLRATDIPGRGKCLWVKTGTSEVHVYVSPRGRSIRVYKNGKELL